jgi:hypothetical protein
MCEFMSGKDPPGGVLCRLGQAQVFVYIVGRNGAVDQSSATGDGARS